MSHTWAKVTVLVLLFSSSAYAKDMMVSDSPPGAQVYIISPSDGEVVDSTVTVRFGLRGMGVSPAGVEKEKTGHHHLMIDNKKLPALDKPMGSEVIHFGGGQTEKTIELSKGTHTLQLILGNHLHIPHNPPVVSEKITITVK
ncbi:MAG: DUF4399 domain-containing protein [Pseudomonadales bacterium]|nr:DUF4399 domain-containing protein [Pseudomonadales bacterium]